MFIKCQNDSLKRRQVFHTVKASAKELFSSHIFYLHLFDYINFFN